MTEDHVLFVQNRSHRAGAQVSLSRLVSQPVIKEVKPHVILGTDGWLDRFLRQQAIPHQINPWPSPRSLSARMGGLDKFARQTVAKLSSQKISVRAVIANDHHECLPAHAIAEAAGGIPVIAILRTPGMTERDFKKYRCDDCHHLFTRGKELTQKVSSWSKHEPSCMLGSFTEEDRLPPSVHPQSMPTRILVAGSEEPRKGFQDFIQALRIVEEKETSFPPLDIIFTGEKSKPLEKLIKLGFRSRFEFAGRVEDFQNFAKTFQLAIHPSRAETLGMAPLELILAGVPTMLSSTGAASLLPISPPWIFPPESPAALAGQLLQLWQEWQNNRLNMMALQNNILESYPVSASAKALYEKIKQLT